MGMQSISFLWIQKSHDELRAVSARYQYTTANSPYTLDSNWIWQKFIMEVKIYGGSIAV